MKNYNLERTIPRTGGEEFPYYKIIEEIDELKECQDAAVIIG